jgi:arabinogalactan endo-1,4-beta-galactosidase
MITRRQKCGFSSAHYGLKLCAAILTANLCIYTASHGQLPAFVRGVDLSFLPQLEAQGVVFRSNGAAGELLEMLGSNGVNCVRLRLWHSPENGWSNLSNTIDMARRVKDAGMALLLDIHYSDTWADPGQQSKPAAWASLSYNDLLVEVRDYTANVLTTLSAQGVLPDGVQVGNEITAGFLWNEGRIGGNYHTNWFRFAELLKAGIAGVTNSLAPGDNVSIILHIDRGGDNARCRSFFDNIIAYEVPFDMLGLSYYPWWHGTLQDFAANVNDLAIRYDKDIVILETAYPWTLEWSDLTHNVIGLPSQLEPGFPAEPLGQMEFICAVRNITAAIPDQHGRGLFYWAPDYVAVEGVGSSWENLALFDFQTNLLRGASSFAAGPTACGLRISGLEMSAQAIELRVSNLPSGATAAVMRADALLGAPWLQATNATSTNWSPFTIDPILIPGATGFIRLRLEQ